jgi:hypothetical protein
MFEDPDVGDEDDPEGHEEAEDHQVERVREIGLPVPSWTTAGNWKVVISVTYYLNAQSLIYKCISKSIHTT